MQRESQKQTSELYDVAESILLCVLEGSKWTHGCVLPAFDTWGCVLGKNWGFSDLPWGVQLEDTAPAVDC